MPTHLNVLKYSPWSPSKASLAGQCGKAFKYRYIDRAEGLGQSSVARIGNVAHRFQERVLEGAAIEAAVNTALAEFPELTHAETETIKAFTSSVHKFQEKMDKFARIHPVRELCLELPLAITSNYKACDYKDASTMIRGIADVVLLLEDDQVIIIDHKSGKKRPVSKYATQLDIYTVMAYAKFPQAKGVQAAIHFMAHDAEVKWASYRTAHYIETVLQPWLTGYLEKRIANLAHFGATITPLCGWCDYRNICEDWQRHGESGSKNT
jgi:hypothetical protein